MYERAGVDREKRKCRSHKKGSITVFLALLLSLVVSLICAGIQSVRMAAARTQILNSLDIGLYSLFAQYDRTLLEDYDLFVLDASNGSGKLDLASVCKNMEGYIKPILKQNSQKLTLQQCGLAGFRLLTDEDGEVFYGQITEYMKETLGSQGVQLLLDKMQNRKKETKKAEDAGTKAEQENTLESYESEMDQAAKRSEEVQKEQEAAAQNTSPDAALFGDGSQSEVPAVTQEPAAEVAKVDNPIPVIRRIRRMGLLELLVPAEKGISDKKLSKKELLSGREKNSGLEMEETVQTDSSLTSQVLYQQYLMEKLGNYSAPKEGGLSYQIEYIICGRDSDEENLRSIARKLLLVREGVNAACLAADAGKHAQVTALATAIASGFLVPPAEPVIEAALTLCWAFGESVLDVRELFAGGRVPLVKSGTDWQLSLENLPHLLEVLDTDRQDRADGLSYEDYLQVFLLSMERDKKILRGMDMVECALRAASGWENFRLDTCIVAAGGSVTVKANKLKTFTATREYYY